MKIVQQTANANTAEGKTLRSAASAKIVKGRLKKMNIEEIIRQLQSIKEDAQTRITDDEPDSIWVDDVKAIDEAIKMIEKVDSEEE